MEMEGVLKMGETNTFKCWWKIPVEREREKKEGEKGQFRLVCVWDARRRGLRDHQEGRLSEESTGQRRGGDGGWA